MQASCTIKNGYIGLRRFRAHPEINGWVREDGNIGSGITEAVATLFNHSR